MNFTLDESYMCDVPVKEVHSIFKGRDPDTLSPDEVMKILKGEDKITSHSSKDHPHFNELRETLGETGYLKIERGWWNGDRVIKPFTLNGKKFKKNEQFPSGCAMKGHLTFMK
jgi:hypothetical protein